MKLNQARFALAVFAVGAVSGCAVDGTEAEGVKVGTTAQALSMAGGVTVSTTTNDAPDVQLGPANEQTCFLSGVSGDFVGDPFVATAPNGGSFGPVPAKASVFIKNDGFWWVRVRAGTGSGVKATVVCVNATAHRTSFAWSDNLASTGADLLPDRRCYFSTIWATTGLSGNSGTIPNHGTSLEIKKHANGWDMNDSLVQNIGGDSDFGGATATCVDLPANQAWETTFTGPPPFGSTTLALHDPGGSLVPVSDAGCWLRGISGRWINLPFDPQGIDDGATLTNDWRVTQNWLLTISNARTATVACAR
jgi:hypothetical protein